MTQIFCLFFSEHNKAQDKSLPRPPPPRQTEMICLHWRRRGWPAAPRAVPSLWAWPRGSEEGARAGLGAAPAAALRAGRALGSERAGGFCPAEAGGVAPPAAPLQGTPPSALSPTAPPPSCNTPATGSWSLHLHDTPVPRPPVLTPQTTSAGSAQPGRAWPLPSPCSFLVPMALWGARARKGFLGRAGTGGREGAPQSGWLGRLGNDPPFCVKEAQVCGRGGGYQGAWWPEHGGP